MKNQLKQLIILLLLCNLSLALKSCVKAKESPVFTVLNGDILFQDLDNEALADAIEKVTYNGSSKTLSFSHVAMVYVDSLNNIWVIEAVSKGVSKTPIDRFLNRSKNSFNCPKVVVGRLKPKFKSAIPQALEEGKSLLNSQYDFLYLLNNKAYYCSELLYEMFQRSSPLNNPFVLNPMNFKNKDSQEFNSSWIAHYKKYKHPIPQGELGLNPNGMSASKNIDIVFDYTKDAR